MQCAHALQMAEASFLSAMQELQAAIDTCIVYTLTDTVYRDFESAQKAAKRAMIEGSGGINIGCGLFAFRINGDVIVDAAVHAQLRRPTLESKTPGWIGTDSTGTFVLWVGGREDVLVGFSPDESFNEITLAIDGNKVLPMLAFGNAPYCPAKFTVPKDAQWVVCASWRSDTTRHAVAKFGSEQYALAQSSNSQLLPPAFLWSKIVSCVYSDERALSLEEAIEIVLSHQVTPVATQYIASFLQEKWACTNNMGYDVALQNVRMWMSHALFEAADELSVIRQRFLRV